MRDSGDIFSSSDVFIVCMSADTLSQPRDKTLTQLVQPWLRQIKSTQEYYKPLYPNQAIHNQVYEDGSDMRTRKFPSIIFVICDEGDESIEIPQNEEMKKLK